MEIIPIFEPNLYSIAYDKTEKYASIEDLSEYIDENDLIDELTKTIELWTNPMYLEQFFEKNQSFLNSGYWGDISIYEAISRTLRWANDLADYITETQAKNIEERFFPLNNQETKLLSLGRSKLKGNWLRLYAIKIDHNRFLITGGAIKLTRTMQENIHTDNEINKLSRVFEFLKGEGVFDGDSFDDLLFEISI